MKTPSWQRPSNRDYTSEADPLRHMPREGDQQLGNGPPGAGKPRWVILGVAAAAISLLLIATTTLGVLGMPLPVSLSRPTPKPTTPAPTATPRQPSMPVPQGAFATRIFTDQSGNHLTYYLYGPDGYTLEGKYPLVVVLHGGGERADPKLTAAQNAQVLLRQDYLEAFASPTVQKKWPCFVVAPQATIAQRWVDVPATVKSYTLAPQPSTALLTVDELVQALQQIYPMIDSNRVYVGGISMGGFGTWEALERWPSTFAAGFPIAGGGDPRAVAAMAHVPVWAFQGSGDAIVPIGASRLMVQAVRAAGGTACYTEYAGMGHNIWVTERPQRDPQVLAWLFSQTRKPDLTAPPLPCPATT